MSAFFHRFLFLVICTCFLGACQSTTSLSYPGLANLTVTEPVSIEQHCVQDISPSIRNLIDDASLIFAGVRVGQTGKTNSSLEASLNLTQNPRYQTSDNLELDSAIETYTQEKLFTHPCFSEFKHLIERGLHDESGEARSSLLIRLPFTKLDVNTVEYLPGKFRRNFAYRLSVILELFDANGYLVFSQDFSSVFRQSCYWQGIHDNRNSCMNLVKNDVDQEKGWQTAFGRAVDALLLATQHQLPNWSRLKKVKKSRTRKVGKMEQEANQAPLLILVHMPTHSLDISFLTGSEQPDNSNSPLLVQESLLDHYQSVFRSTLARQIFQHSYPGGRESSQVNIMVLPDIASTAFTQAMMINCAEQSKGYVRGNCFDIRDTIENVCKSIADKKFAEPGIKCVRLYLSIAHPFLHKHEEQVLGVRDSQQQVSAYSFMDRLNGQRVEKPEVCFNPLTREHTQILQGMSQNYLRVEGQKQNDDEVYLHDAVLDVISKQSLCLVKHLNAIQG